MSGDGKGSGRVGVLQVTDSLCIGGAERVAINLANHLPRDRFELHLCTTREEGELAGDVCPDVSRLQLARRSRFDEPRAVLRLVHYVREYDIRLLHCHKDTIFLAALASLFLPRTKLIWHDHHGEFSFDGRSPRLYRVGNLRTDAVIAVNELLAGWAVRELGIPEDRVSFVPNFVMPHEPGPLAEALPGEPGGRIVCVANLRRQKDQINLIHAMAIVVKEFPGAHALLVGVPMGDYPNALRGEIVKQGLEDQISILGPRTDISAILSACDVGVLSSADEGLPLSLVEYGMAGMAAVSTRVGQCEDVLAGGEVGLLVSPRDPEALAAALVELLASEELRRELGERFRRHVEEGYGRDAGIRKVCAVYDRVLDAPSG